MSKLFPYYEILEGSRRIKIATAILFHMIDLYDETGESEVTISDLISALHTSHSTISFTCSYFVNVGVLERFYKRRGYGDEIQYHSGGRAQACFTLSDQVLKAFGRGV